MTCSVFCFQEVVELPSKWMFGVSQVSTRQLSSKGMVSPAVQRREGTTTQLKLLLHAGNEYVMQVHLDFVTPLRFSACRFLRCCYKSESKSGAAPSLPSHAGMPQQWSPQPGEAPVSRALPSPSCACSSCLPPLGQGALLSSKSTDFKVGRASPGHHILSPVLSRAEHLSKERVS